MKKLYYLHIQLCLIIIIILFVCFIYIRCYSWFSIDKQNSVLVNNLKVYSYNINSTCDDYEINDLIPGQPFIVTLSFENSDNEDYLIDLFFKGDIFPAFKITKLVLDNEQGQTNTYIVDIVLDTYTKTIASNILLNSNSYLKIEILLELIETNTNQNEIINSNFQKEIIYGVRKYE